MVEEGAKAPAFTLEADDGGKVSLADLEGKKVVLYFYPRIKAYGAWGEKNMYGKKMEGILRTTVVIDEDGKVAKVFPKVKVAGHVEEVLAAL